MNPTHCLDLGCFDFRMVDGEICVLHLDANTVAIAVARAGGALSAGPFGVETRGPLLVGHLGATPVVLEQGRLRLEYAAADAGLVAEFVAIVAGELGYDVIDWTMDEADPVRLVERLKELAATRPSPAVTS